MSEFTYGLFGGLILMACGSEANESSASHKPPAGPNVLPIEVSFHEAQVPILGGTSKGALWRMDLVRTGSIDAFRVERLELSFEQTPAWTDIRSVALYAADSDGGVGTTCLASGTLTNGTITFDAGNAVFRDAVGSDQIWLTVALHEKIDIDHKITARCTNLELTLQSRDETGVRQMMPFTADLSPINPPCGARRGVAVRRSEQDDVCRSRIPGLITTPRGTLLAIFDARHDSSRDLQGDIDIGLHRSIDGGRTWQPLQIIMDLGSWGGLPEKYNGVSDPCILVDDRSGTIFVAACWMYGIIDPATGEWVEGLTEESTLWEHQWTKGASLPGWDVKQTAQFVLVRSDDDGITWSKPVNLTEQVKPKSHHLFVPAPGRGITMSDGTLIMPTQGRNAAQTPYANILYNEDGGQSWSSRSSYAYLDGGECTVAELSDGTLMLNTGRRANIDLAEGEGNGRGVTVTSNLGRTWTEHPSSCGALIEPPCMASLWRHHYTENGEERSVLLFFNPAVAGTSVRSDMTLKVSFDDGMTWPEEYWIVIDAKPGSGYSCMTSVGEEYVGILFEGSQADLTFVKVSLDDLLKKNLTNP